jgi:hypothetical protein
MRWIKLADEMKFPIDKIDVDFFPGRCDLEKYDEAIQNCADETDDGYSLVIIDTSQAFFQGTDENAGTDMLKHAMTLRGLTKIKGNPTVIVLCHPVKNWNPGTPLLPRGGGPFLNEIDGNLTLMRVGSSTVVEMYWAGKFRGPDFEKLYFEFIVGSHERLKTSKGRSITTVFAKPVLKVTAEQKRQSSDNAEERLLFAMDDGAERSLSQIAEKCGWFTKDSGKPRKQFAMQLLKGLPAGIATQSRTTKHWRLTDKGREHVKKLRERPL